jgi:hypothetical protein
MHVETPKHSPDKRSNSQILRCKISVAIGLKMSQKYLKKRNSSAQKLISTNLSHKSKKTAIKEECKINSAFVFTLEGIHGQFECLVGWEDEGEEEKQTRYRHGTQKITKQHSIPIGPEIASTFVALMHFVAQYG